ncbi:MAG: O-antigen ligase family protein [Acidobacteria bacterium]|nr:O-antigen ligase family protein [Acidobacteriota bacterium]
MHRSIFDRAAFAALCLFVASIPVEKVIEVPGLGTISRIAGLLCAALGLIAIAVSRRIRRPGIALVVSTVWVFWIYASQYWTLSADGTAERIGTHAQLLLIAMLLWQFCTSQAHVRALAMAYAAGIAYSGGNTVYRWLTGAGQVYYQRFAVEGFDPNDLALTLALGIPLLYWLSLTASSRKAAWMWRALIGVAAFNIFLTASRGGVLALATALLFVPWTFRALGRTDRVLLSLGALAVAAALVAMVPATSWQRIATLGKEAKEGTLNSRTVIWSAGLEAFTERPVTGVGAGAFPESIRGTMGRPRDWAPVAHNTFLSILVETGLVGFAIFLLLMATLCWQIARMPWMEARLWIVLLAVWTVGVSALSWEHRKPTWLLFAMLPAHAAAVSARRVRVPAYEFNSSDDEVLVTA